MIPRHNTSSLLKLNIYDSFVYIISYRADAKRGCKISATFLTPELFRNVGRKQMQKNPLASVNVDNICHEHVL